MASNQVNSDIGFRMTLLANEHVTMGIDFNSALEEFQRELLIATLEKCRGNQLAAADLMRIHRNTLSRMMKTLGVTVQHYSKRKPPQKVIPISHASTGTQPL